MRNVASIAVRGGHIACFAPANRPPMPRLLLERYAERSSTFRPPSVFWPPRSRLLCAQRAAGHSADRCPAHQWPRRHGAIASTLGDVKSKYDCVLALICTRLCQ